MNSNTKMIDEKKDESLKELKVDDLEARVKKLKKDIKSMEQSSKDNSYQQNVIDIAEFLLSDKGIKTEFYNMIVPLFNTTVNDYLKKFGLNIAVIFDNEFNHNIKTMIHDDINYFSFSQGERSRIDISILLTFIKLSKSIANWDSNLLLLDEVIDQNLDSKGLLLMLDSIKNIASEEDLTAMIISHKLSDVDFIFDRQLVVTKECGFSVMTEQ